jgi:hypothetical protein
MVSFHAHHAAASHCRDSDQNRWVSFRKQRRVNSRARRSTPEQKAKVLALAKDFPRLWHAPTTQSKDRKRMLRLLIKDITVEKPVPQKQLLVHIRWQGGVCTDLSVQLPPGIADRVRYPAAVVDKVRDLARRLPDSEIAEQLNREGHTSAKGKPWTAKIIQWVRCRYRIPPAELRRPEELTVQQVAQRFGVSDQVVYYWIGHDIVRSRRINPGMPHWITISGADEQKLHEWARNSRRIQPRS